MVLHLPPYLRITSRGPGSVGGTCHWLAGIDTASFHRSGWQEEETDIFLEVNILC